MGVTGYATGVALTLLPDRLAEPLKRRKPTVYVVNFISDRFDEAVPTEYRRRVRSVIIDRGAPS